MKAALNCDSWTTMPRVLVGAVFCLLAMAEERAASASVEGPATDSRLQEEIDRAERWALYGVLVPVGAAAALSIATNPSENDVPTAVIATIGGLFAVGGTWGTSLGYYRIGRPGYATLSGLGKTLALGGGLLADVALARRAEGPDGEGGGGIPILTALGIAGVVVWDILDYRGLEDSVRQGGGPRAHDASPRIAPVLTATATHGVLGIAGRF